MVDKNANLKDEANEKLADELSSHAEEEGMVKTKGTSFTKIILTLVLLIFAAGIVVWLLSKVPPSDKEVRGLEQRNEILNLEVKNFRKEVEDLTAENKDLSAKMTELQGKIAEENKVKEALAMIGKGQIRVVAHPDAEIRLMNSTLVYADLIRQNSDGVRLDPGYYKIGVFRKGYLPGYADICLSQGETLVLPVCSPGKVIIRSSKKAKKAAPPPVVKPAPAPTMVIVRDPDADRVQVQVPTTTPINVVPCDDCPSGEKIILNLPRGK